MAAVLQLLLLLSAAALAARGALPPPEQAARVARVVLHSCDWGALATLSAQDGLRGHPFANVFSLSDGAPGRGGGSGVPYLYLTDMEISVRDLRVSGRRRLGRTRGYMRCVCVYTRTYVYIGSPKKEHKKYIQKRFLKAGVPCLFFKELRNSGERARRSSSVVKAVPE